MLAWLYELFEKTNQFMPHGACFLWLPALVRLHVAADTVIGLSYYSIPFALWYLARKRKDILYPWVLSLFATFILLCGTTHLISIWTIWHPDYWFSGLVKLATALVSVLTAVVIWPLIPAILRLPSPETLKNNELYIRAIFNATPDAMLISDKNGVITMVNHRTESLLGYRADELIGQLIEMLVPERFRDNHEILRQKYSDTAAIQHISPERWFVVRCKDGAELDVDISLSPIPTQQGLFFATALRDITERKKIESEVRIAATAFESQEAMMITDKDTKILRVNKAFIDSTGYSAEEVIGKKANLLKSERHDQAFYAAMWASINATGTWQGEIWDKRKNGEAFPKWLTITAVKDSAGRVTHYVSTHIDISKHKAAEEEIKRLAFYDPLTKLPNRRLLLDRLQKTILVKNRTLLHGALLFIDLDNFKVLNDTLGHDKGDQLLQQVAHRLALCVRESDTVARLGGDEFVVMLEGLSNDRDEAYEHTLRVGEKILVTLNQPYFFDTHEHHSSPSIGVTLFKDENAQAEDLLKKADIAMYQAKEDGRNTLRFFDPAMQLSVASRAKMSVDLHKGLQQNQFALFYQPQVDKTGRITGVEALVRWRHPERGLVMPSEFIPLAEESGLIIGLGQWVLETACRQIIAWSDHPLLSQLTIAVNVSIRQFLQPDFTGNVINLLQAIGANPGKLKFELTESLLAQNINEVITKIAVLKAKGIVFSLDDFGTGYSSLYYLKLLQLDQLKIDQSFVKDILVDTNDAAIAKMIIALAESMGLEVIAEGVESEEQRRFLAEIGCYAYQGYLYGKPMPVEQLEASLALQSANASQPSGIAR